MELDNEQRLILWIISLVLLAGIILFIVDGIKDAHMASIGYQYDRVSHSYVKSKDN